MSPLNDSTTNDHFAQLPCDAFRWMSSDGSNHSADESRTCRSAIRSGFRASISTNEVPVPQQPKRQFLLPEPTESGSGFRWRP